MALQQIMDEDNLVDGGAAREKNLIILKVYKVERVTVVTTYKHSFYLPIYIEPFFLSGYFQ